MKKSKGIIYLILVAIVIGLLGYTSIVGFGNDSRGAAKNIKLGLDLEGGVSITYETVAKAPSATDMSDTIYKLQQRVDQYSTEATVNQEGDNRITIEIPGVTDANVILEELGNPGTLYFVSEKGSDGTANYQADASAENGYSLTKTIDELQEDGSLLLSGTDVSSAAAKTQTDSTTQKKQYVVSLSFTNDGTQKFADATTDAYQAGESIAIYYDGNLISVPSVNAAITDGQAIIESAGMTYEEAETLASQIRIGGLNLELNELRSNVVGAQLGQAAIVSSIKAGVIGLGIVCLFMIWVYLLPGLAASLALIIYTGLMLVSLNAFDLTLTLPGIAGIILGIGMAVDANVIIFARVREELTAGKTVKTALKAGFHKALSAILDGNITTLIAAAVLYWLGTGSVKGFAITLGMGILLSMFTALFVTRIIIYSMYAVGIHSTKVYGRSKQVREPIGFLAKGKWFFGISIVVVAAGFIVMGVNQANGTSMLNYSLEFEGGTSTNVTFDKNYTIEEAEKKIVPVIKDVTGVKSVQVQPVQDSNAIIFKTTTMDNDQRTSFDEAMVSKLDVDSSKITYENISSTVSSEMRSDAVLAVIVATICMLIYIFLRFKDIRFAGSAVIALIHDVLVVLAFYAVARVSVGNTFIACMLTLVGYSINATIVIFDRIREELGAKKRSEDLESIVNRSITRTLTRSIYTTFTTFIMVAVLYIMGVTSIREFALPLMVGFICGGYSSVCITGALWYVMKTKLVSKKR
ncbi:MAG: protein translocase subunit SecD [Hespellia sp.]|nr:protein translocase subunit SecD [Hespellia sp.]